MVDDPGRPTRPAEVLAMGDQLRPVPNTSLLFKALRSGGSLQFFCPELHYGNEVLCVCPWAVGGRGCAKQVHHAEWDGLYTTSCGDLPDELSGPRAWYGCAVLAGAWVRWMG
jgi:hypothetical protein